MVAPAVAFIATNAVKKFAIDEAINIATDVAGGISEKVVDAGNGAGLAFDELCEAVEGSAKKLSDVGLLGDFSLGHNFPDILNEAKEKIGLPSTIDTAKKAPGGFIVDLIANVAGMQQQGVSSPGSSGPTNPGG